MSSHGIAIKLGLSLVGQCNNLCATFTPAHLAGKEIVAQSFCNWVSVLVFPLKDLLGYKRWPVNSPYAPLLGLLGRVALIDA